MGMVAFSTRWVTVADTWPLCALLLLLLLLRARIHGGVSGVKREVG